MSKRLDEIHAQLRARDPAAARLVTLRELQAIERQARDQMTDDNEQTLRDLILVKALDVAAERKLGQRKVG